MPVAREFVPRRVEFLMRPGLLWGDEPGVDFWEACARGQVPAPEIRAMQLLRELVDPYQADLYANFGGLPARGSVTGRQYIINRRYGVDELKDGHVIWNWCIAIPDEKVPRTDSVLTLKKLIEGNELEFRRIGNRFGPNMSPGRPLGFSNPYHAEIIDRESLYALDLDYGKPLSKAYGISAPFNEWGTMWHYQDEFDEWFDQVAPKVPEKVCLVPNTPLVDNNWLMVQECGLADEAAGIGLPWI